jgi:hypothetical protein
LAKLADIAAGNALLSGGVGTAPAWGKIGLTTHITGTLAIANGGTGATDAATARANLGAGTGNGSVTSVAAGAYLTGGTITTSGTLAVDADTANTASKVVARDASGNFSAGTITANLTGNASTATSATNVTGTVAIANGGTGQTSATAAFNALAPSQTSNSGKYLTTDGTNTSWAAVSGATSVSNDTSTTSNLYPLFAAATSGTVSNIYTSNAQYLFKPSTGELSVKAPRASNGIIVSSATISSNYTIATGDNAMSAGPISVNAGVTVTVSSGSVWTVV